jgi:hypothetical protein
MVPSSNKSMPTPRPITGVTSLYAIQFESSNAIGQQGDVRPVRKASPGVRSDTTCRFASDPIPVLISEIK